METSRQSDRSGASGDGRCVETRVGGLREGASSVTRVLAGIGATLNERRHEVDVRLSGRVGLVFKAWCGAVTGASLAEAAIHGWAAEVTA